MTLKWSRKGVFSLLVTNGASGQGSLTTETYGDAKPV
jgi:hypothetical protein